MVGLDDNSYLLVGGERGDYSKCVSKLSLHVILISVFHRNITSCLFFSNACLYDVEKDKWTCEGDFQNSYVFPVCGTFKKDGGI